MEISQEERSRIEAASQHYEKEYPVSRFLRTRASIFQSGAEYERTIANTQLSEKDKEMEGLIEIHHIQAKELEELVSEKDRIIAEKDNRIAELELESKTYLQNWREAEAKVQPLEDALRIARETNWIEKK